MPSDRNAGHRQRMRQQYRSGGLEPMQDYQILELLLYYAIPRRDTKDIAKQLLKKYGSLYGVFAASVEDLMEVNGIGENAAVLLTMLPSVYKRARLSRFEDRPVLNTLDKLSTYVTELFIGQDYEAFYMLCLDSARRLLACELLNVGSLGEVVIYPRKAMELVIRHKANAIILTHNHPSGNLHPSSVDIDVTRKIAEAMVGMSVTVIDHIIVSGDQYLSLNEKGLFWQFDIK